MSLRKTVIAVGISLSASVAASAQTDYKPDIFGVIKARFEICTDNGDHRFNVRNSRFGVQGNVSRSMRYRAQIELSSEGKLDVLDSYIAYKVGRFELSVGQQQYRFSTELDRGASRNLFANRSFIGKFLTQYYGTEADDGRAVPVLKSIGSRDIGALASYRFDGDTPVRLLAGIFNGEGINNPEWTGSVNVVASLRIGAEKGFGGSASFYTGNTPLSTRAAMVGGKLETVKYRQNIRMWDAELRYIGDKFLIEAEFAQRLLDKNRNRLLTAAVVHGMYHFMLPENSFAEMVSPLLSWDYGDNIKYIDKLTGALAGFTAHRIRAGVTVGFAGKILQSEIRFNYEHYFLRKKPADFSANNLLHNKFTVEFIAAF